MSSRINKLSIVLAVLATAPLASLAEQRLVRDTSAPVNIQADHMKYELQSGISEYTGNVRVSQSDIELTGDKVIAIQQDKVVKNIKVSGSPATYRQKSEDGNYIQAQSRQMEYKADQNRLVLTDKAKLEQAGSIMESDQIIYDTVKQVVIAGDEKANKRVNITIKPDKIKK
jgi:lipopolysaccharide export system protein LptA